MFFKTPSIFQIICWAAFGSFSIFWIYKYSLNEDLVSVDFKDYYETKEDVLPMLSLCIRNPFSEKKLKNLNLDKTSYLKFLLGKEFNLTWLDIEYHSVLKNIVDYVDQDGVEFRNGSYLYFHPDYYIGYPYPDANGYNVSLGRVYSLAITKQHRFYNCYGLSVPNDKNIQVFYFRVKNSLLPSRIRLVRYSLMTILHYPNQMLYSINTLKYGWPQYRGPEASYIMRFKISGVEVIRRRQKMYHPCNENWENFDRQILNNHIRNSGCRPVYIDSSLDTTDYPLCSTKEMMKEATFRLRTDGYGVSPPCLSMEQISYEYEESTYNPNTTSWAREGTFWIGIYYFNRHFKNIYQTRYV